MTELKRNSDHQVNLVVSGEAYKLLSPKMPEAVNPRLQEDERVFSYEIYAREIHPPIETLRSDLSSLEQLSLPRCLDMPLRLAGETTYRLPDEWAALAPILEQIIGMEHAHNPSWQDYYSYLTVDCKPVEAGMQQRHGGLHVDGFQGERITEKTKVTRNYVATSNGGTVFYPQRFICADPAKYNVFLGFELQADTHLIAEENTVYFMDAYCVHESGFAARSGNRLFIRLTYDLKKFDRLNNSHNSALNYDWAMVPRDVASTVAQPHLNDIMDSPYLPKN